MESRHVGGESATGPTAPPGTAGLAGSRDAATDLGQDAAPEKLEARQDVVLRHPRPADAHGGVGHPRPMLSDESLDNLGGGSHREAIRRETAQLDVRCGIWIKRDTRNPPGQ